jgi:uncharacterized protein YihD (DUF1040 family)
MRDPARIDPLLAELRAFWHRSPDWRLGQLVVNLTAFAGATNPSTIEDDRLLRTLRERNAAAERED